MKNLLCLLIVFCSLVPTDTVIATSFPVHRIPADDTPEMISDIISVIGLKANFEIRAADIPNAAAITHRGKRFIAYNPKFFSQLNVAAGNKWASVSVLAHEIGHHLNGHTLTNTGSLPPLELEADEFSGFVLQKMGASLLQAQAAMKFAASYKASNTHPAKYDRLAAIARGWNNAGADINDMGKYSKPVKPGSALPEESTTARVEIKRQSSGQTSEREADRKASFVLDKKFVLATVDFPSDRSANYYVTTKFNFVKVLNGQLYLLGKMLRTSNPEYPFVMKSDNKQTLFINRTGKILTTDNELAGYIRM